MAKMHAATSQLNPSGRSAADFVRLMIPHHQAAIDMAKVELVCDRSSTSPSGAGNDHGPATGN